MENIKEMNEKQLKEQLKNCYDYEKMVTNNFNGWVHPATAKKAKADYEENRREIEAIHRRLEELEKCNTL